MKLRLAVSISVAAAMLIALPASASAGPTYHPGGGPNYNPKPPQGQPPHGRAYGFFCKGFSKKHVKGHKGTPFSRCVHALKRVDNKGLPPGQACKGFSKKHVKGHKGTPFSRCVKAVAKMRKGIRYESPPLAFGPNGWAGWSCPAGMTVIGGGYEPATADVQFSGPAKPGAPLYPVYPHYTFQPGETGWVVQNDNDTETIRIFVICR